MRLQKAKLCLLASYVENLLAQDHLLGTIQNQILVTAILLFEKTSYSAEAVKFTHHLIRDKFDTDYPDFTFTAFMLIDAL